MLPLDDPTVQDRYRLHLNDLEAVAGLRRRLGRHYRWTARWNRTGRPDRTLATGSGPTALADLRAAIERVLRSDRSAFTRDPFLTVSFRRLGHPASVHVHVRVARDHILAVGVERDVR
jgi:hypothetical protein